MSVNVSLQQSRLGINDRSVEMWQYAEERGLDDLFAEEIAVTAARLSTLSLVPSGPIRPAPNPRYNT